MSKIDLSKAKIGDKFRTRGGRILEYKGKSDAMIYGNYLFEEKEERRTILLLRNGSYMLTYKHELDLIEQVFDKSLDELIQEGTKQIKESRDAIEEENELQRRQEVVELARKMLFDDNTYQFYTQLYVRAKQNEGAEQVMTYLQYVMDYAEDCVNKFNQYLKDGKL